jgi:regulator of PEP synthase PpsR (kinase-PPPase family)
MAKEKEELKVESLEEEVEQMKKEVGKLFELFLPPKEVRREITKNIYTIELSILNIFRTLLDYKAKELERRLEEKEEGKKERVKKIQVE